MTDAVTPPEDTVTGAGNPPAGTEGGTPPADSPFASFKPEIQEWAAAKGFKDVAAALHSGWSAAKMVGVDKDELFRLPKVGDTEGFMAIANKLGRPESADGYEFSAPEGMEVDPEFSGTMAKAFHEAGLTKAQATKIMESYNAMAGTEAAQTSVEYEASVQLQEQDLKRVWGNGYHRQESLAKAVVREMDIPAEAIDAVESSIGYGKTMMLFAKLGALLGEDTFVDADERSSSGLSHFSTPDQARKAYQQWVGQPEITAALFDKSHPGHRAALEQKSAFFKVMAGEI